MAPESARGSLRASARDRDGLGFGDVQHHLASGRRRETLSASGARVVWLRNPCTTDQPRGPVGSRQLPSNDAIRHLNDVVLVRLAEQRPGLRFFDLDSVLCPSGEYVESIGGVEHVRPDGIHLSPEGSLWLARSYGAELLATGLD